MKKQIRWVSISFSVALSIVLTTGWSQMCYANRGVIDFNAPDIGATGESFTFDTTGCVAGSTAAASCVLALADGTNPSSGAISLGFTVKIGTAPFTTVFVNENGILTFGAPFGSFVSVADFTALQTLVNSAGAGPFVAPFYANLTPGVAAGPTSVANGGILYGRGQGDPAPDPDPSVDPYLVANIVPAFHVFWVDRTDPLNVIQTEVILYSKDAAGSTAGNFDMRIRYGSDLGQQYNSATGPQGLAGFVFGGTPSELAPSKTLNANSDYLYHFCGGLFSSNTTCTTTPPPPPVRCDVNGDKDIDIEDLLDIAHALRHKASGPTDPRDADGNGVINLKDLFICIEKCTHKYCATK